MNFYYLSDLHLQDGNSAQAKRFCSFLKSVPKSGDVVVLGGDIFDLFIGNKTVFRERFAAILSALDQLSTAGVRLIYLEGNHDFQIQAAMGAGKIEVRTGDFPLVIGEKKFWISHGDLIDPEDRGYRFLRWITRSFWVRLLIWLMPGGAIDAIGNRSSKESRKYNERRVSEKTKARLRGLYYAFAEEKFALGYHIVLVGHSHIRDLRESAGGVYVNLGISSEHLPYAHFCDGQKPIEIKSFS
jgi:UDP-2,3-diacylglucosamine hydrolase